MNLLLALNTSSILTRYSQVFVYRSWNISFKSKDAHSSNEVAGRFVLNEEKKNEFYNGLTS